MTREELIGYCKYYKGEEECPFKCETTDYIFWLGEKRYVDYAFGRYGNFSNEKWCDHWERMAEHYAKNSPKKNNVLFSDANIHTRGIAYQIMMNLGKFRPYEPNIIDSY